MDRYKPYLLPGIAALVLLVYFIWRATAGQPGTAPEGAATSPTPAASAGKASP